MANINGTSGNDTLNGTSQDDSISGEGGDDTIQGGIGQDTIDGGSGDDTISGGSGEDSITGGDGNDQIYGDGQSDTIDAGAGNDTVYGGDSDDVIQGGDGNDTIDGEGQNDTIDGGSGDDDIKGSGGSDSISGGDGHDTIDGGEQDDTIYGNEGDDVIIGGGGSDVLFGGRGDDTLIGGAQADKFVLTQNGGNDVVDDFSHSDGDIISVKYPGINTFSDIEPFIGSDGNSGTLISLPDGTTFNIKSVEPGALTASDFEFNAAPICFLRGTRILTETGWRAVETLRPGMMLHTYNRGLAPVLHVSFQRFHFGAGAHPMKPIRIAPNTFGSGLPAAEVLVSPQHRVGMPQQNPEWLTAAKKLLTIKGVSTRPKCRSARYYHVLLADHTLVLAEGIWVETLLNAPQTRRALRIPSHLDTASRTPVLPIKKQFADNWRDYGARQHSPLARSRPNADNCRM